MDHTLHVSYRDDDVAVLWLDTPGRSINVFGPSVADELADVLARLEADADVRGLVVASAKPRSFCAGTDLELLRAIDDPADGEALSRLAQEAMLRIERFPRPVVAAIHGMCRGTGLDLALACAARVASSDVTTRLSFPEVRFGLLPAGGGTQRLPRLIDAEEAIELLTTGASVGAERARELGLVDEVVQPGHEVDAAAARAGALAARDRMVRHASLAHRLRLRLQSSSIGRKLLFEQAAARLRARVPAAYEPPARVLEVVERGLEADVEAGMAAESRAFGELVVGSAARALIGFALARRDLRQERYVDADVAPEPLDRIGVVGAGRIGAAIAFATAASAGLPVRLRDVDDSCVARGLRDVHHQADRAVAGGAMSPFERLQVLARVGGTTTYKGFRACPLVISAVFEELSLERQILAEVEAYGPPGVIFATSGSILPLAHVASHACRPDRVIGMHYPTLLSDTELLEIAVADPTAPEVLATTLELGRRQGKTCIVVNDGPGFYVSRVRTAYLAEAVRCFERGVPIRILDRALENFGMRVGPLRLVDALGLDAVEDTAAALEEELGPRFAAPALARLTAAGHLGEKSGRGFYVYDDDGSRQVNDGAGAIASAAARSNEDVDSVAWRCCLRLVDEAMRCYGDGILGSSRDGDVAAVLGLGFPGFRGGPFHLIAELGPEEVVRRMRAFGIEPAPLLTEMTRRRARPEDAVAPR